MSPDKNVFLFGGTYPSEAEARLDYEVLRELHAEAVLGVAGGVMGHLWKGMSRTDVKELGDLDRAMSRATKRIAKEVEGDATAFADSMAEASND